MNVPIDVGKRPATATRRLAPKARVKSGSITTLTTKPTSETRPNSSKVIGKVAIEAAQEIAANSIKVAGTNRSSRTVLSNELTPEAIHGVKTTIPAVAETLSWKPMS